MHPRLVLTRKIVSLKSKARRLVCKHGYLLRRTSIVYTDVPLFQNIECSAVLKASYQDWKYLHRKHLPFYSAIILLGLGARVNPAFAYS